MAGRVVTIDGPSGAGKSTVSRRLAARLGFRYLDTGALYRAVAWSLLESGRKIDEPADVAAAITSLDLAVEPRPDEFVVMVDGKPVGVEVRTSEVSRASSRVSTMAEVRGFLLDYQRDCAEKSDIVAEGRDMGTVVFPGAGLKFWLDAAPEERARRRHLELIGRGETVTYEAVLAATRERDARDRARELAPLRPARDMIVIDATTMSADDVVEDMVSRVGQTWPELKKGLSSVN
ncbi:MAG: (d)CMP kinase [Proteobacteria bacterium]|nr:(d)CMP kinase [Pseudomonadota bacterium]